MDADINSRSMKVYRLKHMVNTMDTSIFLGKQSFILVQTRISHFILRMVQRMMCRYKAQEIPPWVRRLLAKAKNRDFRSEKTDRRPSRFKRSDSVPTKTKVSVIASDPTLGRSLDVDSQRPSKLRPPTPFKIFKDENVPLSENRMKVCNHSTQEPKKQLFSWTNNGSVPILPTAVGDGWEDETDENIQNPRKSQKAHLSNFTNIEAAKHSRFGRMRLGTTKNFGMRCTKPSSWHTSKIYQIRKTFSLPKRNQKIVPASEDASCINPANEQELVLFEAYQTTLDSKRFFESESRGRCACSGKLDLGNCMLQ
mmetsp:Transcript_17713/g.28288  ORF Transcript_17713/g.28288 Transcript_17713/m.28288 type:complete len:310 (+) Transcript_17713:43-972(+)